jgi:fatty acid desaturase
MQSDWTQNVDVSMRVDKRFPHIDQSSDINVLRERMKNSGLMTHKPWIYWVDFMTSSIAGWLSILAISQLELDPMIDSCLFVICIFSSYRGVAFVHEIAHWQRIPKNMRGFITCWNLLSGTFFMLSSMMHRRAHLDHHNLSTYATARDPEYLQLKGKKHQIIFMVIASGLLSPIYLYARTLLIIPLSFVIPDTRSVLRKKMSTLAMNVAYVRNLSQKESAELFRESVLMLMVWAAIAIMLMVAGDLLEFVILHFAIITFVAAINYIRALASHRYGHAPSHMQQSREDQVADSIDIKRGLMVSLLAPVGLQYHAVHHLAPDIPYHNLAAAHAMFIGMIGKYGRLLDTQESSMRTAIKALMRP